MRRSLVWTWALVPVLGLAVVVRAVLLPTAGLPGDLDQFVLWVHGLAIGPLGHAYDQNLSFPPVMAYVWGALAALEPAFRTVTTSADPLVDEVVDVGVGGVFVARGNVESSAQITGLIGDLRTDRTWYRIAREALDRVEHLLRGHARGSRVPERKRRDPVRVDVLPVGSRHTGGRADDQAAGPPLPRPVRCLVPCP